MLGRVGIPEPERRVDDYPHQFSGGQKQRIVIAMALALDPTVIVADEPTTALDVTVQAEILELLRRLRDEDGTAIVLITHNMGVVADLADRVAVMLDGEIVETATAIASCSQRRSTSTPSGCSPRFRASRSPTDSSPEPAAAAEPVVVARGPGHRVRRALRSADLPCRRPRELHDRARRGPRPGRRERLGQDHDRPRHRRPHSRRRRVAARARHRDARCEGAGLQAAAQGAGLRLPGPGDELQPAADDRRRTSPSRSSCTPTSATRRPRAPKVDELLEAVQLPKAFGDRFPHELSGGQRQRASLARALALDPKLLIADEPTSALDVSVQARVLELFRELQERFGFATLFITHDLAVVDLLAHRIVVLHNGRDRRGGPDGEGAGQSAGRLHEAAHRVAAGARPGRAGRAPRRVGRDPRGLRQALRVLDVDNRGVYGPPSVSDMGARRPRWHDDPEP